MVVKAGKKFVFSLFGLILLSGISHAKQVNVCDNINIQKNIHITPKIISKTPVANNSLCQIIAKVLTPRGDQNAVFYATKDFVIVGTLFQNGKNITSEIYSKFRNSQFASVWKKYKSKIDNVVATTYVPKKAEKGKIVYEIADPNCPFCEKMKPYVKKFADKYGYTIKLIFFSFERPSSPKKTSNFICNHKPFVDYFMNNLDTKTCKKGDEYVKKANQMARNLGVNGTPTFIFKKTGTEVIGANPVGLENGMKAGQ